MTNIQREPGAWSVSVIRQGRYFADYFWFILKNVIGWIFILAHEEVQGKSSATEASLRVREEGVIIPLVTVSGTLVVRYEAERNRKEHLRLPVDGPADDAHLRCITKSA